MMNFENSKYAAKKTKQKTYLAITLNRRRQAIFYSFLWIFLW